MQPQVESQSSPLSVTAPAQVDVGDPFVLFDYDKKIKDSQESAEVIPAPENISDGDLF